MEKKYNNARYWNLNLLESNETENQVIEKLEKILDESCSIHTRSDVPIGLMLSGGVDSNIVGYFFKKNHNKKFNSFTFGNSAKGLNEFEATDQTSKEVFHSNQINVYLNFDDVLKTMPKVIRSLEVQNPGFLSSWQLIF